MKTSTTPLLASIALLVMLAGCHSHIPPAGGAYIKVDAASLLRCPQRDIQVFDIGTSMRQAMGCGRSELYVNTGAYNDMWRDTWDLRQRAGFDLGCSAEDLSLVPLSGNGLPQIGVTGCGKRAVYVLAQTSFGTLGWILDSTSTTPSVSTPGAPTS